MSWTFDLPIKPGVYRYRNERFGSLGPCTVYADRKTRELWVEFIDGFKTPIRCVPYKGEFEWLGTVHGRLSENRYTESRPYYEGDYMIIGWSNPQLVQVVESPTMGLYVQYGEPYALVPLVRMPMHTRWYKLNEHEVR